MQAWTSSGTHLWYPQGPISAKEHVPVHLTLLGAILKEEGMDADGHILQPPVLQGTVPGGTSYAPQRPLNLRN